MKNVTNTNGTPHQWVKRGTETRTDAFVNEAGAGENQVEIGTGHTLTEPPSQKWIAILAD